MERVAIAVLYHKEKFLVGQRDPNDFLAGLWEFPGGKIKPGEVASEAAIRECKEETGLDVVVIGVCSEVAHNYQLQTQRAERSDARGPELSLSFFACRALDPTQPVTPPFCWIPATRLPALDFPAANRSLLEQLLVPQFIESFWGRGI